ncbi:MAG: polyhydroxyalkanoate synthesis regulator DNA-binding domain-containing protein [Candidatus Puniceispirillum sp.]
MESTTKPNLTIHRYSSRKFYNKDTKEFVTLEDISRLIKAGHSVTILDKKTGEDITNQYLLTIISEFEGQGEQVIPKDFLTEIIKSYSDAATQVWPQAIEQMMDAYRKNQENMAAAFGAAGFDPTTPEKNMDALKGFQQMQSEMMSGMLRSWQDFGMMASSSEKPEAPATPTKTPATPPSTDIDDMKEQIRALQAQLQSLSKKAE